MQIAARLVEAAGGLSMQMVDVDDDAQVPDTIEVDCGEVEGKPVVRVFAYDSTMQGWANSRMNRIPVYREFKTMFKEVRV